MALPPNINSRRNPRGICRFRSDASFGKLDCGCQCEDCKTFLCHCPSVPLNSQCVPATSTRIQKFIDARDVLDCQKCPFHENATQRRKWPYTVEAARAEIDGPMMYRDKAWAECISIQWAHDHYLTEVAAREYDVPDFKGRGIVIPAGGPTYFPCAYVAAFVLRNLGCTLPIQFWYLGEREMSADQINAAAALGVECVDATKITPPMRIIGGWQLKPFAMLHCPFSEVLLMDADNIAAKNPTYLFNDPNYLEKGAMFWPDPSDGQPVQQEAWAIAGIELVSPLFETGQVLVNKTKCYRELKLAMHMNEHSDFWYHLMYGDKDTFLFAWEKLKTKYAMPPMTHWTGVCFHQKDMSGDVVFNHCCQGKKQIARGDQIPGVAQQDLARKGAKHLMNTIRTPVEINRTRQIVEVQSKMAVASIRLANNVTICRVLGDIALFVPTNDVQITPHLCSEGNWESELTLFLGKFVRPGMKCLDVGANVGYFTALFARLGCEVDAIEPNSELVELIGESRKHNAWKKVEIHNCAVGSKEGLVSLKVPCGLYGQSYTEEISGGWISQYKIDDIIGDKKIDLVKMDIEGGEVGAWDGMENLRKQDGVHIVMELHHDMYKDPGTFYQKLAAEFPLQEITENGDVAPVTIETLMSGKRRIRLYLHREVT